MRFLKALDQTFQEPYRWFHELTNSWNDTGFKSAHALGSSAGRARVELGLRPYRSQVANGVKIAAFLGE